MERVRKLRESAGDEMSFTDDDLARYKSFYCGGEKSDGTWVVSLSELKALIARLEAAEQACEYAKHYEPVSGLDGVEYKIVMERWHKAAGK